MSGSRTVSASRVRLLPGKAISSQHSLYATSQKKRKRHKKIGWEDVTCRMTLKLRLQSAEEASQNLDLKVRI